MISEEDIAKAVVVPDAPLTNAQKWASRVIRFGRDGQRKPPVHPTITTKSTSKRNSLSTAASSNSKSKTSSSNSHSYSHSQKQNRNSKADKENKHATKTSEKTTSSSSSPKCNLRHKWAGALAAYLFRLKPMVTHSLLSRFLHLSRHLSTHLSTHLFKHLRTHLSTQLYTHHHPIYP